MAALRILQSNPWPLTLGITVLALAYFAVMLPADITWVNAAHDGPSYLIGAKYLRITYPTGDPLYMVLGWGVLNGVPFGSDWWRMAAISAVFGAGTAGLLYYHTRSLLAPLLFMASGIVVSQATIVEKYTMVTFFVVLAYHFWVTDRKAWGYGLLGLALAVHHTAGFFWLGFMWADYYNKRPDWKLGWLSVAVGLPWYLYLPLANRAPFLHIDGTGLHDYYRYCCSQGFLWGGMAVLDGPLSVAKDFQWRTWDFARILLGGFGPFLALLFFALRDRIKAGMWFLPVMFGLLALYYFTNLDPHIYTYTVLLFALGALMVGTLAKDRIPKAVYAAAVVFAVGAMGWNLYAYNIGGALTDPHNSAQRFEAQLAELPSDAVVWSHNRGWEKLTVMRYNFNHGTQFDVVNVERPWGTREEIEERLTAAYQEGRLYKTIVTNPRHHVVMVVETTPTAVIEDLATNRWLGTWAKEFQEGAE